MRAHSALSDAVALATVRAASWLLAAPSPHVSALRPRLPLILYEFEACPFCRRVREALEVLGIEAEVRPCPKGGERFRPAAIARGGRAQFPFLVDPNTGSELYESSDIVSYLYGRYAASGANHTLRAAWLGSLASALRLGRGSRVRASRAPALPLLLSGAESNPEARLVREMLSELELFHISRRGDPNGSPVLEDPNANARPVGWPRIRAHLEYTYALGVAKKEPPRPAGSA
jgi:glutaredoxin